MKRTSPWAIVLFCVAILTAARTLQAPMEYAVGHWLLDWRHGLVPRGLVGTLLLPLWRMKTGEEIAWAIDTLALGTLGALLAAFAAAMARIPGIGGRIAALAAVTSGWVVFAGHLVGYLDQLVELLVIGAALGVATKRPWAVLLMVPAILVHEIAAFFLPLLWVLGRPRDLVWSVPALLTIGALVGAVRTVDPAALPAMEADLNAYGVLDSHRAPQILLHLRDAANAGIPPDIAARNLLRADVLLAAAPVTLLIWGGIVAALWGTDRRRALLIPLASAAPLTLHLLGWDAARFTLLVPFAAAVGLAAVGRAPRSAVGAVLGLAVIAWNLHVDVPLMQKQHDGGGALWPRSAPEAGTWSGCREAFPNAGFEKGTLDGWTGDGFVVRPAVARANRVPGTVGSSYATSFAAQGDAGTGTLSSPEFTLEAGDLLVAVGGEARLEVGDTPLVVRGTGEGLTGASWAIPPDWAGRTARIVVRDEDPRGNVRIDGVCWFRR